MRIAADFTSETACASANATGALRALLSVYWPIMRFTAKSRRMSVAALAADGR
jgi:hypothetical protein